jgi:hypothetical protein
MQGLGFAAQVGSAQGVGRADQGIDAQVLGHNGPGRGTQGHGKRVASSS